MRILFCLPQLPEDPGSRPSGTILRIAQTALLSGNRVRVLGTTAMTLESRAGAYRILADAGYNPGILPARSQGRLRPEIHYTHGGVPCRIVDTGKMRAGEWEEEFGTAFDTVLESELAGFQPEIVVLSGTAAGHERWLAKIRKRQIAAVLSMTSPFSGAEPDFPYDAAFCHSRELARRCADRTGLAVPVLLPPVPIEDVRPPVTEPVCVVFPAPSRENGLYLLARLAEQLSLADPDCPILVSTHAGAETAGRGFLKTGFGAGFDLGQYENILFADPAADSRQIWATARIFVLPSLGIVPVSLLGEALVNGIPAVVSEQVHEEGILEDDASVAPLPIDYGVDTRQVLPASAVEPWTERILSLMRDETLYASEAAKAQIAGAKFAPEVLAPVYDAFFRSVLEGNA